MPQATLSATSKKFKDINSYIAAQDKAIQPSLEKLREVIRKAAPKTQESISWSMPTYKQDGIIIIHFAAFKNHYSVFLRPKYLDQFREELDGYETSKSTIQFPNQQPVPVQLITKIVKYVLKMTAAETA